MLMVLYPINKIMCLSPVMNIPHNMLNRQWPLPSTAFPFVIHRYLPILWLAIRGWDGSVSIVTRLWFGQSRNSGLIASRGKCSSSPRYSDQLWVPQNLTWSEYGGFLSLVVHLGYETPDAQLSIAEVQNEWALPPLLWRTLYVVWCLGKLNDSFDFVFYLILYRPNKYGAEVVIK